MKMLVKRALLSLAGLLALGAALFWWLSGGWSTRIDGTLRIAGVRETVTIARDAAGIPRIVARNDEDAAFALGFVHAQDRLWQMEMQRRLGAGRLAEVVGEKALPTDRFMRTLGIYRLAEQSFSLLQPETQRSLQAYSDGVNAYLRQVKGSPAPEFLLTRLTPEPWKPADTLVWARLMALQLSGNWRDELLRASLLTKLPADQVNDLWQPYPAAQPTTIGLAGPLWDHMLAAILQAAMPRLASLA